MKDLLKTILRDILRKRVVTQSTSTDFPSLIDEIQVLKDHSGLENLHLVKMIQPNKYGVTMSLTWKSIGHAFASGFSAIVKGSKYIEGAAVKIEGSEQKVEQLSALIPGYGPAIVGVEQIAYAGLGMIVGGLHYGGAAFEQNLLDNGSDQAAIDEIKAIYKQFPNLLADIEAVFGKPVSATAPSAIGVPQPVPVK